LFKLLLSDLDGTLRGFHDPISPAVKSALREAAASGVRITLATGRILQSVLPYAEELEVNAPLVCCNGGLIIDHRTRQEIAKRTLPLPVIHTAMRFALEHDLRFATYLDDHSTSLRRDPGSAVFFVWAGEQQRCVVEDPFRRLEREPLNCLLWAVDEPTSARTAPLLQARMGNAMRVTRSAPTLMEVILADVSKARGAAVLAAHLGIAREEVLALGDSDNDVELLAWAGLGVAVGSATPAACAAADCVVGSVAEDGAAEAVRRFILAAEPARP
jgi:Cof subfamily protein (haloacid dehalogenase superfamily)